MGKELKLISSQITPNKPVTKKKSISIEKAKDALRRSQDRKEKVSGRNYTVGDEIYACSKNKPIYLRTSHVITTSNRL